MGRTRTLADAGRELLRLYGREAARGVVAPAEDTSRIKFTPFPGPQTEARLSLADEIYFGGAAGGGKTAMLCGLALTDHRNSLLLRRVSVDTKGICDLLKTFAPEASWKSVGYGGEMRTPDGRVVEVGGCQYEDDWKKYQGRPHDYFGFDELPTFSEKQYTTLIGWNRVADPVRYPNQRCRVIGAGNPPTDVAGEWVMKRWRAWLDIERGEKVRPGELRYYVVIGDKEEEFETGDPVEHQGKWYRPKSRTFIPARLEDNPALLATGYDATLESLPEPLRSMLRYGDFSTARVDDRWQLIPKAWVLAAQKRWAANRDKPLAKLSCVGVDVAMSKGKGDQTVIARRYGNRVGQLVKRAGSDTPDGQSVLMLILQALGGEDVDVNIDATGIGKSAYDMTQTTNPRMQKARAVMFGGGTDYRDPLTPNLGFANLRSAMFWNLRQLLNPEGGPEETRLELPPDGELLADLTAPRYSYRTGKVFVEPKDDGNGGGIRSRLGRSTDAGDATALCAWESRRPTIAFG